MLVFWLEEEKLWAEMGRYEVTQSLILESEDLVLIPTITY